MALKTHIFKTLFKKKDVDMDVVLPVVKKEQNTTKIEAEEDGKGNETYEILEREIMPERIICPECGGYTLEGLDFCDKCGGDLTNL